MKSCWREHPHRPLNVDFLQNRLCVAELFLTDSCQAQRLKSFKEPHLWAKWAIQRQWGFKSRGAATVQFVCASPSFSWKNFIVHIPALPLCVPLICVCVCERERGTLRNVHPADSALEDQWPCRGLVLGPPALRQERAISENPLFWAASSALEWLLDDINHKSSVIKTSATIKVLYVLPPPPAVGCSNMVSLCDAGSRDGCVGLLWAADAQRGQCSSEAERLHTEMSEGAKSTSRSVKNVFVYCRFNSRRFIIENWKLRPVHVGGGWTFSSILNTENCRMHGTVWTNKLQVTTVDHSSTKNRSTGVRFININILLGVGHQRLIFLLFQRISSDKIVLCLAKTDLKHFLQHHKLDCDVPMSSASVWVRTVWALRSRSSAVRWSAVRIYMPSTITEDIPQLLKSDEADCCCLFLTALACKAVPSGGSGSPPAFDGVSTQPLFQYRVACLEPWTCSDKSH